MLRRRALLASASAAAAAIALSRTARAAEDPILIGVSGPLTGQYAQYGAQWQRGFDLALDQVNGPGERPIAYQFEDSQSDPRQTVAIAQKFVSDPRIVAEIGDFSSAASMAASPIYQRGHLVQFGFTNSHPDFTRGGDYVWSNAPNQEEEMPVLADYAVARLGLRRLAVLYVNSDWGRTSRDLFARAAEAAGAKVLGTEGYLADEKDFRSTLVRVRDLDPDGLVLISYYPDGAQIVRQIRGVGLHQPVVAASSVYSPKFLELGGDATEGVYTSTNFFAGEDRPEVRAFVQAFEAKYGTQPDAYNARAYDAMVLLAAVIRKYGADRKALQQGLGEISGVPSVVFGSVRFDPQTRRLSHPATVPLMVRGGHFVKWDGQPAHPVG